MTPGRLFEELVKCYYCTASAAPRDSKHAVCFVVRAWLAAHERLPEDVRLLVCNFEQVRQRSVFYWMYACLYVCLHVCMFACMFVCLYV